MSRPLALPLASAIAVHWLMRWRARSSEEFPVAERWLLAGTVVGVGMSAGLWPLMASIVTGEPNAYLETMAAWKFPAERLVGWQSWVTQAPEYPAAAVIALGWVGLLSWFLLGPRRSSWIPELRSWSLCYTAFLLLVTMPQAGTLRHLLLILVPFWPLTELNEATLSRRSMWALACTVGVLGLLSQYFWLRWYWVPSPHWHSVP